MGTNILGLALTAGIGIFTGHSGPGSVAYDAGTGTYTVVGGDSPHYVWIKMSGDVALSATVDGGGASLMIRQSLNADSPYIDGSRTSLHWRETPSDTAHEIESNIVSGSHLRLEKRGDFVSVYINELPAGGAAQVHLTGDFYVGLAARSTAHFSHVRIGTPPTAARKTLISTLQTISVASKVRRVAYVVVQPWRIEAPNWFPDSTRTLYFNSKGHFFRLRDGALKPVDLGTLHNINNAHGVTRDGKTWAFSSGFIYVMSDGPPRQVTENAPSYFHGWSPDGQTLVYCALRAKNFDIYSIPVNGGVETRLTTNPGKDDGPEFSPDGRYIYYNSDQSGSMQIWRMRPDGAEKEQVTNDDADNWFPHLSPDGTQMAFLSYDRGVGDHPENKNVRIRVMSLATGRIDLLARVLGGQGTINVNSWSPDSQSLAFISYQIVPDQTHR